MIWKKWFVLNVTQPSDAVLRNNSEQSEALLTSLKSYSLVIQILID